MFPCGCSAHDAVRIRLDDVGTAAYPVGDGLARFDIEEFRQAIGDEPLIWWHDLPPETRTSSSAATSKQAETAGLSK